MALKRSIIDIEPSDRASDSTALRKRARISPSAEARSDSSMVSLSSVPKPPAMGSSPDTALRGQEISASSVSSNGNGYDSDSSMDDDSASSTSAEEEDEVDESGAESETVVTLGASKKPEINSGVLSGASDLASRLKAFLPQMQQANNELTEKGAGLSMEDVDDEEEHIEMSLGLGVLEQKKEKGLEDLLRKKMNSREDDEQSVGSDSSDQTSEEQSDVLDRLMNMERESAKAKQPSIEEVDCRPTENRKSSTAEAHWLEHREDLALRQNLPPRSS